MRFRRRFINGRVDRNRPGVITPIQMLWMCKKYNAHFLIVGLGIKRALAPRYVWFHLDSTLVERTVEDSSLVTGTVCGFFGFCVEPLESSSAGRTKHHFSFRFVFSSSKSVGPRLKWKHFCSDLSDGRWIFFRVSHRVLLGSFSDRATDSSLTVYVRRIRLLLRSWPVPRTVRFHRLRGNAETLGSLTTKRRFQSEQYGSGPKILVLVMRASSVH